MGGEVIQELPSFLLVVGINAASHALAGRSDEARQAMRHLRELNPRCASSNLVRLAPLDRPEDFTTFAGGLRKAGLPD